LVIKLSDTLSLHYESQFPYSGGFRRGQSFKVLISIGGNIGNTKRRFQRLFQRIERDRHFRIIETSPILKNPPFGFKEQEDFFNAVILLETNIYPKTFLRRILYLEKRFGRVRTFRNAPRTLDIDIIFFDNFRIKSRDLTVPHRDWKNRESVIIPMLNLGKF
jgi:2-amino-4-hydroxy-6-hydroxymethyldihydropteridine diphosphokinase